MDLPHYAFEYSGQYEDALSRAAGECGVDLSYWDIFHHQHYTSGDALRAILSALGWDVSSLESLNTERLHRFEHHLSRPLAKTSVISHSISSSNSRWRHSSKAISATPSLWKTVTSSRLV